MNKKLLWQPSASRKSGSKMYEFLNRIAQKYNLPDREYATLHQWSVENISDFWSEIWDFCHIRSSKKANIVIDDIHKMPGAKWFEGAMLNFAENLLSRKDDHTALIFKGESSVHRELTYAELYEQVRRVAAAMKNMGIVKGDRIAAFMPNMPETIIGMLAATSIGAIWSSTSPDFGAKGVLDRFSQIKPKLIFAADGYYYKSKIFDSQQKLADILQGLPSVEKTILVDYTGSADVNKVPNAILYEDFAAWTEEPLLFEQLPFDHPLYIMYSSGTTGLPKSIVHSAGGTLIQHLKELILHNDIQSNQTVFYFTTCGWMMWNWFVSSLAIGATLVLYDGNPFYPKPDALLRIADELDIAFFGTSAKYIASLENAGVKPQEFSDFPKLKVIASTGSPLSKESFEFVYRDWKADVQLASIAGGTDIISCFVLGNPMLPVYKEEIQCKGLGMNVDCLDASGTSIVGRQGELVCKSPFPSMPIYFFNDEDDKKYQAAYFEEYPGIWHHGDFIEITEHGGIIMHGRSDATLNPQGVRIGTAEIYNVVENMDEIADSVVVGKKVEGDEQVVLFVKLNEGYVLDGALTKKINTNVKTSCSPRHVPTILMAVPDIPYTLNGKKVEIAVKKIIHGQQVKNKAALANPECLDFFVGMLD